MNEELFETYKELSSLRFRHRVKIIVSTKQSLLEDRVNKALEELENDGMEVCDINMNISFAGPAGYQILAYITYIEEIKDELEDIDVSYTGLDFGAGMSFDGGPISEA